MLAHVLSRPLYIEKTLITICYRFRTNTNFTIYFNFNFKSTAQCQDIQQRRHTTQ